MKNLKDDIIQPPGCSVVETITSEYTEPHTLQLAQLTYYKGDIGAFLISTKVKIKPPYHIVSIGDAAALNELRTVKFAVTEADYRRRSNKSKQKAIKSFNKNKGNN